MTVNAETLAREIADTVIVTMRASGHFLDAKEVRAVESAVTAKLKPLASIGDPLARATVSMREGYAVDLAFTSEADAKAFADSMGEHGMTIEQWEEATNEN